MFSVYLSSKKFEMIEFRRKEEEGRWNKKIDKIHLEKFVSEDKAFSHRVLLP
jgi:hypothetical protein